MIARVHGFALSKVAAVAPDGLPFEQWRSMGQHLSFCEEARHWWIGDWLNYGERNYGDTYTQMLDETDFEYQTLRNDKYTAGRVQVSLRKDNLTHAHHALVAPLSPAEQEEFLEAAERGDGKRPWTWRELRQKLAERKQAKAVAAAGPLPEGKRRCIVIDPPWPMEKSQRSERPKQGRDLDYKGGVMTLEQIEALPVASLADPAGCHLFLWVTHRFLPDGLRLMAAWGFTYHCLLTWVKPTGMTPFSWMFNTEHVLFGYSGKFEAGNPGLKVSFEAPAPRGEHSAKPDVFYERVRAFSDGPRLEMFQREPHEGFEGWGDERQQD